MPRDEIHAGYTPLLDATARALPQRYLLKELAPAKPDEALQYTIKHSHT